MEAKAIALIASDVAVWAKLFRPDAVADQKSLGFWKSCYLIFTYPGLRAGILYRLSHFLAQKRIKLIPQIIYQINLTLHGLDIPPFVPIGPGLYIPHPAGIVVTAERIGSNCTLVSVITIGMRNEHCFPRIGNDVYIGAGARVLGNITIGNNVKIGANAVVITDVPDDSIAVGVPAKVKPARLPRVNGL